VPVYNHPDGIQIVCEKLNRFALPCLLVDDGSDAPCRDLLRLLADRYAWVELLRFEQNRGKGAAVSAGLAHAQKLGFSHALQVDADAQHDLADVPRFIAASRAEPAAIVTGTRVAEGISAARHYGRKLTDMLVWLETLSTRIEDSMCGYRLYPLPATMALLGRHKVGQRMDFDTDILVRLMWRGVPVTQLATRVIYRDHIPSHFRMVADNLRITRMHTLLVLGMIIRSPLLLRRKLFRG
tara:strand:- start:23128 stop:23844 length:717 start_codon:yes stop_codon:yes gene_type:complete